MDTHDIICAGGTACVIVGVACIYWPAAIILGGLVLIAVAGGLAKQQANGSGGD